VERKERAAATMKGGAERGWVRGAKTVVEGWEKKYSGEGWGVGVPWRRVGFDER